MLKQLKWMMLIVCIALVWFSIAQAETGGACGDDVNWALDDDGMLTISGNGNMLNYSNVEVNGNYITTAPWGADITNVVIEYGVTNIGDFAFRGCANLTSVLIPDSVTHIGRYSFNGCSALTSIVIPDAVNFIGWHAFEYCSMIESIFLPDSVETIEVNAFDRHVLYANSGSITALSLGKLYHPFHVLGKNYSLRGSISNFV